MVERTNIRAADPAQLGAPFDLVVVDVSFISLRRGNSIVDWLGQEVNWFAPALGLIKFMAYVGTEQATSTGR